MSSRTTIKVGWIIRDLRRAIGWSQREVARRSGVSQPLICAIETGRATNLTFASVTRILAAMGSELLIDASRPFLGDRERQRDPAHARCTNHVVRRLEAAGWRTATEVEVGGDRSRGWIDVLAWHPSSHVVLVVEVKTELHDLGAIERTLNWYEREAWAAARRQGWVPRRVTPVLLLLATDAVETRLAANRQAIELGFPVRAPALTLIIAGMDEQATRGRAVAVIDPRSRNRAWLRPPRIHGRRSAAPYASYADFMNRCRGRPRSD
jgi:transcriptional regulator with XRE-family HTH domain